MPDPQEIAKLSNDQHVELPTNNDLEQEAPLVYPKHEQHMLANVHAYRKTLADLDLSERIVVELGIATGVLTQLLLEKSPQRVIGYELDPELVPRSIASNIELKCGDFTKQDFSVFEDPRVCLIANPPYIHVTFENVRLPRGVESPR